MFVDDAHRRLFDRHIQSCKVSHRRRPPSLRRPGIGACDGHSAAIQRRFAGAFLPMSQSKLRGIFLAKYRGFNH
jgi:hypothetical protein